MDYSFIRLMPTFEQAKGFFNQKQSKFNYFDCISLRPDETYLQTTSSSIDIVFNESYKATIIDGCENELKDITSIFTIKEFIDLKGIRQISFEIYPINECWYGMPVYLKIESTIGNTVFYSNAFCVTDELTEYTIRLDYKSYGYFQGTDYPRSDFFQSIRVKATFLSSNDETESSTYTQVNGNVISQNPIIVTSYNYMFEGLTNQCFKALQVALKNDLIYIDGYRNTDKVQLKNGDLLDNSNMTDCEAVMYLNLDDFRNPAPQLSLPFQISLLYPTRAITNSIASTRKISAKFTKDIVLGIGNLKLFKYDGSLVTTLTQNDFSVVGNELISNENISEYLDDLGSYYITFTQGLIKSNLGDDISITDNTTWTFKLSLGDYLWLDYSNNDFLIHE